MIVPIGIDVSKSKLDIYHEGKSDVINNVSAQIRHYFLLIDKATPIVMESTGKYHRLSHRLLEELGFKVMVINPYQSRHFAKALNILCKTDKVDARMLSEFGDKLDFKATPCASDDEEARLELSRHLDDLKKTRKGYAVRKKDADGFVKDSLSETIKALDKQIKKTEQALEERVQANQLLMSKVELLISIPGIGIQTAISILSYLKEIGALDKQAVAALAGLAPMNYESGRFQGKRRIQRGRKDVRSHLYMPTLGAATQHNIRLKKIYTRLVEKGKPKKVAITACMRKLLVWANAILATGEPWQENYV